jgi:hypothetical protein
MRERSAGETVGSSESKLWILQWFGIGVMVLAWVAGSGMYYLRYAVVDAPRTIYAPEGGLTSDSVNHGSPKVLIMVSTLVFFIGLATFLVGRFGQNAKAAHRATRLDLAKTGPASTRDTASSAEALYARYQKQKRK